MRVFLLLCALTVLPVLGGWAIAELVQSNPVDDAKLRSCSVKIYLDTQHATGSGANLGDRILTCRHVTAGETRIRVVCEDETAFAVVVSQNVRTDTAVLSVKWLKPHPTATLANSLPRANDQLRSCGRGVDGLLNVQTHRVVELTRQDISDASGRYVLHQIMADNATNSGRSGGGVYNSEGLLVGMVRGNFADTEPYRAQFVDLTSLKLALGMK